MQNQSKRMNRMVGLAMVGVALALVAWAGQAKALAEAAKKGEAWHNVDVPAFEKLLKEHHAVLDVRTAAEFAEGHIAGAVNLDGSSADFERNVGALKKDVTYLVYCHSGRRSARACRSMAGLGFSQLYNLEGGLLAWQREGKPVQK